MREFYEECDKAIEAKDPRVAVLHLKVAQTLVQPLIQQARSRLELRTVMGLAEHLRWAKAWAEYIADERKQWPGFDPCFMTSGGSTYVYPPTPRTGKGSLDYRWGMVQDRSESYLPWVPANMYGPTVRP